MLIDQIMKDLNDALKGGEKMKLATLRFLVADIKKFEIDTYLPGSTETLTDSDVEKIIRKQVKNHEESIAAFQKGERPDLVEKEEQELQILKAYLPSELSDEEIKKVVVEVKAKGPREFGPLMGMVMKQLAGKASGDRVAKILQESMH